MGWVCDIFHLLLNVCTFTCTCRLSNHNLRQYWIMYYFNIYKMCSQLFQMLRFYGCCLKKTLNSLHNVIDWLVFNATFSCILLFFHCQLFAFGTESGNNSSQLRLWSSASITWGIQIHNVNFHLERSVKQ